MHLDATSKAEILKKNNEEMRQRIADLKKGLQTEQVRVKESHREKVSEMQNLRESMEVCCFI